jgi:hypothetical protein
VIKLGQCNAGLLERRLKTQGSIVTERRKQAKRGEKISILL